MSGSLVISLNVFPAHSARPRGVCSTAVGGVGPGGGGGQERTLHSSVQVPPCALWFLRMLLSNIVLRSTSVIFTEDHSFWGPYIYFFKSDLRTSSLSTAPGGQEIAPFLMCIPVPYLSFLFARGQKDFIWPD